MYLRQNNILKFQNKLILFDNNRYAVYTVISFHADRRFRNLPVTPCLHGAKCDTPRLLRPQLYNPHLRWARYTLRLRGKGSCTPHLNAPCLTTVRRCYSIIHNQPPMTLCRPSRDLQKRKRRSRQTKTCSGAKTMMTTERSRTTGWRSRRDNATLPPRTPSSTTDTRWCHRRVRARFPRTNRQWAEVGGDVGMRQTLLAFQTSWNCLISHCFIVVLWRLVTNLYMSHILTIFKKNWKRLSKWHYRSADKFFFFWKHINQSSGSFCLKLILIPVMNVVTTSIIVCHTERLFGQQISLSYCNC